MLCMRPHSSLQTVDPIFVRGTRSVVNLPRFTRRFLMSLQVLNCSVVMTVAANVTKHFFRALLFRSRHFESRVPPQIHFELHCFGSPGQLKYYVLHVVLFTCITVSGEKASFWRFFCDFFAIPRSISYTTLHLRLPMRGRALSRGSILPKS